MKQELTYSLKVWLTTAVIAPLFVACFDCFFGAATIYQVFHIPKLLHDIYMDTLRMIGYSIILFSLYALLTSFIITLLRRRKIADNSIKWWFRLSGSLLLTIPYIITSLYSTANYPNAFILMCGAWVIELIVFIAATLLYNLPATNIVNPS